MERCSVGVCETTQERQAQPVCPQCKGKGKKVESITVRYLLKGSAQRQLDESLSYHFCLSPSCQVVYFSGTGNGTFIKDQISERVTIKEKEDPLPICYCFNFFRHDVVAEIRETERTTIPDFISNQVKAGNCFCEYTNPQGTCCLGNVNAIAKELKKEAVE